MSTQAHALHAQLRSLVASERRELVRFLLLLDAFDREAGYFEFGRPSLWMYLLKDLGLRESVAARRIAVMKLLRQFPQLDAPLADGRLCITTIELLAPLMTPENVDEVVRMGANLTKEETLRLRAELQPREPPREGIRRLPTAVAALSLAAPAPEVPPPEVIAPAAAPSEAPPLALLPPPRPRIVVEPCTPELDSMRVTIDVAFRERLGKARDLASHRNPKGDLYRVLFDALGAYIEKLEKDRGLATPKHPRPSKPPPAPTPGERAPISDETRRIVWARDGGRCQRRGPDGEICGSTFQLELHHRDPAKVTGSSQPEDLELRCKPDNRYEANVVFGKETIDRIILEKQRARRAWPRRARRGAGRGGPGTPSSGSE